MKVGKIGIVAAILGFGALLFSSPVARAGDQDFTLVNKTGVTIHRIMVSPHDDNNWGEDVMGKDVLSDGESVEIKFSRTEAAEDWDLKIVDKEGNAIVWGNLRLTKITKLTIHFADGKATAEIE